MIQHSLFEYLVNSVWQVPLVFLATWLLRPRRAPCSAGPTQPLGGSAALRGTDPSSRHRHASSHNAQCIGPNPISRHRTSSHTAASLSDHSVNAQAQTARAASAFSVVDSHPSDEFAGENNRLARSALRGSIAFSLARLVRAWYAARRLVDSATISPLTTLETTLLKACALRLQLPAERIPEIRFLIDPFASPMIIGIRHPVLLLPESVRQSMSGFNDHTLAAILSHELAHVRRRDYLSNLAARIIALPISYHPATHTLHRRIRQTREMICDSDASGAFNSSAMYARSLIALAERMIPQANVEAVGLFDHARNTLEERIMKLTEPRLPISLTMRTARIAARTIVLIAGTCAAATLHLKPSTPLEHAVQVAQAAPTPAPIPDPAASPAPQASSSPKPRPQAHSSAPRIVINGQQRELTPEERKRLDEQLDSAQKKIDSRPCLSSIMVNSRRSWQTVSRPSTLPNLPNRWRKCRTPQAVLTHA